MWAPNANKTPSVTQLATDKYILCNVREDSHTQGRKQDRFSNPPHIESKQLRTARSFLSSIRVLSHLLYFFSLLFVFACFIHFRPLLFSLYFFFIYFPSFSPHHQNLNQAQTDTTIDQISTIRSDAGIDTKGTICRPSPGAKQIGTAFNRRCVRTKS